MDSVIMYGIVHAGSQPGAKTSWLYRKTLFEAPDAFSPKVTVFDVAEDSSHA
jgi:hypothetical protein